MKAIEVEATVDEQGQLSLDKPLTLEIHSRVRVIVLVNTDDREEEISESPCENFRQGWHDVVTGNVIPISQLWDGIDAE